MTQDRFPHSLPPGAVIGSLAPDGSARLGVDAEGKLSIDSGGLRIGCPDEPGWGRHALVYGPHARRGGVALVAFLLNGHNASQTVELGPWAVRAHAKRALWRAQGAARAAVASRLRAVPGVGPRLPKRREHPNHYRWPPLRENLAVGWFDRTPPARPGRGESAFVMRADGPSCGTLCATVSGRLLPVLEGVQNVPLYLVCVLRAEGAVFYGASYAGARGLAGYPALRPLAIDARAAAPTLFAGVHQAILGEIRFRAHTRVYGLGVLDAPAPFGLPEVADALSGEGALEDAPPEAGGAWELAWGGFARERAGARPTRPRSLALLAPRAPAGLIQARLRGARADAGGVGLVWRARDRASHWAVRFARGGAELVCVEAGRQAVVARDPAGRLGPREQALLVIDDGQRFTVALEGRRLFGRAFEDARLGAERGVGLWAHDAAGERRAAPADVSIRQLEVHPREVRLPAALDVGAPWRPAAEHAPLLVDTFEGPAGELEGRRAPIGRRPWRRVLGRGRIDLTGAGEARVRANPARPNPGRTLYTLGWDDPSFVELEVELVPPGERAGDGQLVRGGVVLWESPSDYVVISEWNDDRYPGASVSSFFLIDGREDVYDAVWTNVGQRIARGRPNVLRVAFDGLRWLVHLDDEPVLYRSLIDVYPRAQPLQIRRVGLAVNWEFGDDTGTVFRRFVARGR